MNNKWKIDATNETLAEKDSTNRTRPSYNPGPLISTLFGKLKGERVKDTGILQWLGVPYARSPAGDLRWKAPREPEAWDGVKEATRYGNSCVQTANGSVVGEEDCLYLNIWRQDRASSNLPVLVFAHGGGNMNGSGQDFKGDRLAKATNSIVISVNYRLGAMGFFRHPALRTGDASDDSGNYGLLDILHALKWVRGSIERFGGDPNNVTLAGQSAGARNVLAALISPLSDGLFHKSIVVSGGMTTADPGDGDAKSEKVLRKLLVDTGAVETEDEANEWAASQSPETIADFLRHTDAKHYAQAYGPAAIQMEPFPHLFEDGTVIPEGGFQRIDEGSYRKVPIILGSTATEFSGFALNDPEIFPSVMDRSLLADKEKSKLYAAAVQYGSDLYAGFNVEQVAEKLMRQPDQPPVFAYRFGWGTRDGVVGPVPRMLLGAAHGADLMFYTGDFASAQQTFPEGYITEENEPGRLELSKVLHEYVKQFLYHGHPNGTVPVTWKEWNAGSGAERILTLDADTERAIVDMNREYLKAGETIAEMEADPSLTAEQKTWIKEKLFAGRFFWTP